MFDKRISWGYFEDRIFLPNFGHLNSIYLQILIDCRRIEYYFICYEKNNNILDSILCISFEISIIFHNHVNRMFL